MVFLEIFGYIGGLHTYRHTDRKTDTHKVSVYNIDILQLMSVVLLIFTVCMPVKKIIQINLC